MEPFTGVCLLNKYQTAYHNEKKKSTPPIPVHCGYIEWKEISGRNCWKNGSTVNYYGDPKAFFIVFPEIQELPSKMWDVSLILQNFAQLEDSGTSVLSIVRTTITSCKYAVPFSLI